MTKLNVFKYACLAIALSFGLTVSAVEPSPIAPAPDQTARSAAEKTPMAETSSPTAASPTSGVSLAPIEPGLALLFPPVENGVQVPDQNLEYALDGESLKIGDLAFSAAGVAFDLGHPSNAGGSAYALQFSWPSSWLEDGTLTVTTTLDQKVLYSTEKSILSSLGKFEKEITAAEIAKWDLRTPFKFCLEKVESNFKKTLCSKNYILVNAEGALQVKSSNDTFKNQLTIDGAVKAAKDPVTLPYDKKSVVAFTFSTGTVFSVEVQPVKEEIIDFVQTDEPGMLGLTAKGGRPVEQTELDSDGTWKLKLDAKKAEFYLWTENNFQLKQTFKLPKNLPTEKMRPVLKRGSRESTYSSHTLLHGSMMKDWKVTSTENAITAQQDNRFEWDFSSKDKNQLNVSHVKIAKDKDVFSSSYSLYRGYPFEVGSRFTAAFTGSSPLVLGELLGSAWAESLFGSENSIFSVLRWGVSVRYVSTLVSPTDSTGLNTTLNSLNGDLKYRFSPGIWNQDATFGAMLSYQQFSFDSMTANMGGAGLFWVHPFPSSFDRFLNKVKWFRYPKVLDAEIQYFFLPATSGVTLGTNLNAVVHSKLFIKPDFFVELGFSMRQFAFSQAGTLQTQGSLLFTTGGVGWDF